MTYNIPILRNVHIWGPSLIRQGLMPLHKARPKHGPVHILFCLADHFEPKWNGADPQREKERVQRWAKEYPRLTSRHRDSYGRCPQHTWFYAGEQYNPVCLEAISRLCSSRFGEIELHLHHGYDTADGFKAKLERAKEEFAQHGALITSGEPSIHAFGFIHGDWALNNSREGSSYCGVDNELRILRDAGCYADFTLPSAPQESQTAKVNSIYYAIDIPGRRKSHDRGIDVRVGGEKTGDLMLIQGPLALNWRRRKWGVVPRIENGCILNTNPGTPDRIDLWVKQHIHVVGRPEWIFIKVHCHGAQEDDIDALLGGGADNLFRYLEERYNDGRQYRLHYVTAREMYNIVKAAEAGCNGDPFSYKDYLIKPYLNSGRSMGLQPPNNGADCKGC